MTTQQKQVKPQKTKGITTTQKSTKSQNPSRTQEEDKQRLIAETAYFIAERRGFQGDMVLDDWLQAEREVNSKGVSA